MNHPAGIIASEPGLTTGYLVARDANGERAAGIWIECGVAATNGIPGHSLTYERRAAVSDTTGLVQFRNLIPGMSYTFVNGRTFRTVLIACDAGPVVMLPSLLAQRDFVTLLQH